MTESKAYVMCGPQDDSFVIEAKFGDQSAEICLSVIDAKFLCQAIQTWLELRETKSG